MRAMVLAVLLAGCAAPAAEVEPVAVPEMAVEFGKTYTMTPSTRVAGIMPVGCCGAALFDPRPENATRVEVWASFSPAEGMEDSPVYLHAKGDRLAWSNESLANGTRFLATEPGAWRTGDLYIAYVPPDGSASTATTAVEIAVWGHVYTRPGVDTWRG